jgi:hypothetical protein
MKNRKRESRRRVVRVVTTLGDLVAAAYEAAPGFGVERLERARLLLTQSPLARALSPHLEIVWEV